MELLIVRHFFVFIFSALLTCYLVPMMIHAAYKFNILDRPDGKIKTHQLPVSKMTGFAYI